MSEPLVVVGNGMAATRFVGELMQRALGRYSVIVIGAEPRLSYNRVLLSSLLAGDVGESAIELKPRGWWNRHGVTTLDGQAVAAIDRRARVVTLANGQYFTFSKLVLATGSRPIRLPKPGMKLQNVLTFRDLADVGAMRALMRPGARAAVIGGGLLGIEAAYGLAKAGVKVTLVHLMDRLMERQLEIERPPFSSTRSRPRASRCCSAPTQKGFWAKIAPPDSSFPAGASLPPISWSARLA
jgi:nitrite reductase (NADH) large subunit